MAIPENVKRQAMDAVNHKETTAQIRLYRNNDVPAQTFSETEKPAPATRGPIPDHVKKQAMDAVSHKETTAQIRLVKDNGSVMPTATPSQETNRTAEKIAQMHKTGHDADAVQRQATKDNFERANG
jgi:hypothetical protein